MQVCIDATLGLCKIAYLMTDELIPTKTVAEMFGKTVATINRWVLEGKLTPAIDMGGRTGARLYRRSDVEAFLNAEPTEQASA